MKSSDLVQENWSLFARALPSSFQDSSSFVAALQQAGVRATQWEASVRFAPTEGISGQRMMFESSSFEVLFLLASLWGYSLPPEVSKLQQICRDSQVPIITGWDAHRSPALLKLYVNASDLSLAARTTLWDQVGWGNGSGFSQVPHLVALNFSPVVCEQKVYVQAQHTAQSPVGPLEGALLEATWAHQLYAGSVTCWDRRPDGRFDPRAFFVAIRGHEQLQYESLLRALAPWTLAAVDQVLPFVRGQCRSVGVSLTDQNQWTAYFKPQGLGVSLWHLEPVVRFVLQGLEVSVFVEPAVQATRAYAYTQHAAISFRTQTEPTTTTAHAQVAYLMKWVVAVVRFAEKQNISFEKVLFGKAPPLPWRRVVGRAEGIK